MATIAAEGLDLTPKEQIILEHRLWAMDPEGYPLRHHEENRRQLEYVLSQNACALSQSIESPDPSNAIYGLKDLILEMFADADFDFEPASGSEPARWEELLEYVINVATVSEKTGKEVEAFELIWAVKIYMLPKHFLQNWECDFDDIVLHLARKAREKLGEKMDFAELLRDLETFGLTAEHYKDMTMMDLMIYQHPILCQTYQGCEQRYARIYAFFQECLNIDIVKALLFSLDTRLPSELVDMVLDFANLKTIPLQPSDGVVRQDLSSILAAMEDEERGTFSRDQAEEIARCCEILPWYLQCSERQKREVLHDRFRAPLPTRDNDEGVLEVDEDAVALPMYSRVATGRDPQDFVEAAKIFVTWWNADWAMVKHLNFGLKFVIFCEDIPYNFPWAESYYAGPYEIRFYKREGMFKG
ncbi:hypothetical protein NA57DRAFT_79432 [Rhizodiscina lignyota]|uniref:Uncharacterized protein n=1 Tax=Rhizodiscina lignyota TaxID=1504668 RepID=A0A9P4I5U4_9PEZI|nr:hypothetical protein NA57DRAFT_79432 [Rhizodiscina lignyota]